ncbi:hypothetical protein LJC38_07755, partial [Parabacteroides sp. OttesenSCG-928-K15]|nr:hypothetical protein [Parabacteroides sp. OttesenSCG-928-K15]
VISGERNFNFRDLTRVKVVGRVTGGKVEHGKPLGFGESKNNIGAQTLILSARKDQYKLTTNTVDTTFQHNNGEWKKSSGRQQDESRLKITGSDITITVSNVTGEFMVDLYPEAYLIERVNYGKNNNDLLDGIMEELDLTLAAVSDRDMMQKSVRTWVDSIKVDATPNQPEYMKPVESSDTLYYHKSWTYFQQAYPTFSVQQLEGAKTIAAWGDKTYTRANPITGNKMEMDLYTEANGKVNYQFDMPVFLQGGTYKFKFKAFEEYVNDLSAEVEVDRVDVTSGEVRVLNNMELTYKSATVQLDSIGEATYSFYVGSPDLTTGMKTFEAVLYIDNIPYYWNREESTLTAFVLGGKINGC